MCPQTRNSITQLKLEIGNRIGKYVVLEVYVAVFEGRYFSQGANFTIPKAELLLLKLIHLFAREVLLVKELEIEETMTT